MNKTPTYASHTGGWGRSTSTGATLGLMLIATTNVSGVASTGYLMLSSIPHQREMHGNSSEVVVECVERTPIENLQFIREYFNPAISDLASVLNVTRQSIYNWISGAPVKEENFSKLQDLAQAAVLLEKEGVAMNVSLLKRKFSNGKTLFQIVQSGESAQEAARQLANVYKREQNQRQRLEMLRGRKQSSVHSADFDLPAADLVV